MPTNDNPNAAVIAEFRANAGEVGAPYPDPPPMLLLHTIGARSGREHVVPMRCLIVDGVRHVFGSAHGSSRHPDWHYNLLAHADIDIEQGTAQGIATIPVRAVELHAAERNAIFARQAARFDIFSTYAQRLERTIPVFRLEERSA